MKLWVVQMEPKLLDKKANIEKIVNYMGRAAEAKVDLLVFPEMALTGYMCQEKFFELAEPVPGPSTQELMNHAKKKNLYVLLGLPELSNAYVYNSAALLGPEGLVGVYRKLVLATVWSPTTIFDEGMFFKHGVNIETFDTRFGRIGVEICRDIYYPEITRAQAYQGAMILVCISAAPGISLYERFHVLARARAQENCSWFIYVNHAGKQKNAFFGGGSCIVSYTNEIKKIASAGNEAKEEVIEQEIDMNETLKERLSRWYLVGDSRADLLQQAADIVSEL